MDEQIRSAFTKSLRKLMSEQNKTQADLCAYMHISSATAAYWYNGKKMPRVDKLQRIADWLSVEMSALLGESDPGENESATLAKEMANDPLMIEVYRLRKSVSDERFRAYIRALAALVKEGE